MLNIIKIGTNFVGKCYLCSPFLNHRKAHTTGLTGFDSV